MNYLCHRLKTKTLLLALQYSFFWDTTIKSWACGVTPSVLQVPKNKMKNREYTGNTKFIEWDFGDYEEMSIRIVRFKITDTTYEIIFTSLPRDKFSLEDIKTLYGMR